MYVTVEQFQSNCEYATEDKAAWPLDSALTGIKAEPTTKFFIWCYKFQAQDYMVSKCTILQLSKFFHFLPPPYPCPQYFSLVQQSAHRWSKL